ncbi:MAG: NDP-sugar synthase [Negativicutes bacterium]|nr:NDP-sugar synthase [Negativicutes bacterium]
MQAVILTGGSGRRLWPYSEWQPKACLPLANRPLLARTAEQLSRLGCQQIMVVSDGDLQTEKYVLRHRSDCEFLTVAARGTAAAVSAAFAHSRAEWCLVVHGDIFTGDVDICRLIERFAACRQPVVLVRESDEWHRVDDLVAVRLTGNGSRADSLWGHPRRHYADHVAGGVYALPSDIMPYLDHNPGYMRKLAVGGMPARERMLEQSLQMWLEDGRELLVEHSDWLIDIDFPWHLAEANYRAADSDRRTRVAGSRVEVANSAVVAGEIIAGVNCRIGEGVIVKGDLVMGDNVTIDWGAIIEPGVTVGDNAIITDRAMVRSGSIIGNGVKLGYNAEFSGIVHDGCSLAHNCQFYGIIGLNCDIGAGTQTGSLRFDDQTATFNINGKRFTPPDHGGMVYLGDYCRTGVGALLLPGVRIGHSSCVGPGVIVDKDLPANSLLLVEQQQSRRGWGPHKYGW